MSTSRTGIYHLAMKVEGKLRLAALMGVTIFDIGRGQ